VYLSVVWNGVVKNGVVYLFVVYLSATYFGVINGLYVGGLLVVVVVMKCFVVCGANGAPSVVVRGLIGPPSVVVLGLIGAPYVDVVVGGGGVGQAPLKAEMVLVFGRLFGPPTCLQTYLNRST